MVLISIILNIYIWGAVCILLFFLFAIGQFYEKKSGRRSFYSFFLVPILFFGLATIRYTFLAPAMAGDVWGDILRFAGGVTLGGMGLSLLKLMIGGRP